MFKLFPFVFVLFFSLTSIVQMSSAQSSVTFKSAKSLHDQAREGNEEAIKQSIDAFTNLVKSEPENALALAYLGSSYAISAREASVVTNKIRYTNRGLRYLDQAVTLAPQNFVIRLIRANVTSNLPSMFGRSDTALEDMLLLDELYSSAPTPKLAGPMLGIYAKLEDVAPKKSDWANKAAQAKSLLAGK
ncbi:hypothetical protein [Polycladidibacter stylochi]|uniref:hypothetical protein n=1 Tax=Polycladidibacter stylochi TaxID=1807766 RepID=UPI00082BDA9D|nr:hypothetical protein [Pseudovibrio stylochi]